MGEMTLKEMHERLMLFKMVKQAVEKSRLEDCNNCTQSPWLCNVRDDYSHMTH
ncbi:MAG: hypothetical protein ACOYVD_14150 [Bacillota bacterium]